MLKKVTAVVMAAAMTIISLAGCGGDGGQGKASDKVKISFSFWEPSTGTEMEDALSKIVENYKSVRPDVEDELISASRRISGMDKDKICVKSGSYN